MKKKLTSLILVVSMIITLTFSVTIPAFANTSPTVTRLAGADRYSTATAIANQGWSQSDYAILAYGENYPDALSAAPLAKKYNAPILLTTSNSLPDTTKQTLTNLKVKNVFIIGGTGVISISVESELQSIGITPTRLAGQDRYETAIKVAQQISSPSTLFVAIGEDYPDALSVAPIAASKQIPIILVPKDYMPDSIKNYVSSVNVGKTYVIGYSDIIDDSVVNQFPNPERITGADKYSRNIAIDQKFNSQFTSDGVCVATGEGFADALTGAVYASSISKPIVLVNNASPSGTKSYYQQRIGNSGSVTVFGGVGVVPDSIINDLSVITPVTSTPTPTTPTQTDNPKSPLDSKVPTNISDLQDYLNNNFYKLTVNGLTINFSWKVNDIMVGDPDIQAHAYIDILSYKNWLILLITGHQSDLQTAFSLIFNKLQTAFPDKKIWMDGIYEDYYIDYPSGYNYNEVSYDAVRDRWKIFHEIFTFLDEDGLGGNSPYSKIF